uniref:Uncharacterized protein n=1 Tax=Oryza meridionalis TaxID=40149 RepID=A0A0E0FEN1_9ORYZ
MAAATRSVVPAAPTTSPAVANVAADTTSKKIPVEGAGPHEEYVPAAEVASALPVPIPDGNPVEGAFTNGGLGGNQAFFPASSGYGTAAGLGAGGFGPYGGYGAGPGTYGYNGPLYFGSAPTRTASPAGSCAAAAAVLLLLSAAMYI